MKVRDLQRQNVTNLVLPHGADTPLQGSLQMLCQLDGEGTVGADGQAGILRPKGAPAR